MLRHLKPLLALPLLCLVPAAAAAGEPEAKDFLSQRSEHVTLVPDQTVALSAVQGQGQTPARLADVSQTFYLGNWTGVLTAPGGSLTGSSVPLPLPNPLNFTAPYAYSGAAQALVPAATPWTQIFAYTTNPSDPYGQAKTCIWQIDVSVVNGVCAANITTSVYGQQGATCLVDSGSNVNTTSCQLVVGVGIQ